MGCRVGISEGGAHRRSSPAQLPCRDTERKVRSITVPLTSLRIPLNPDRDTLPTYLLRTEKDQKRGRQETRHRNEYPILPAPGEPARLVKTSHLSELPSYPDVSRLTSRDVTATAHAHHTALDSQTTSESLPCLGEQACHSSTADGVEGRSKALLVLSKVRRYQRRTRQREPARPLVELRARGHGTAGVPPLPVRGMQYLAQVGGPSLDGTFLERQC
ncbi:hypothetical protein CMEL01_15262 [Colletotrichum melonis]|uniref:Uncharacterized protein n=1 Tax=Colletotrichum melonis TaxID=1209925 RepID=A0AAI9XUG4_9PEZI|nr:hypothetical protein CMEL01_15262 [Colletotrichum melonis]